MDANQLEREFESIMRKNTVDDNFEVSARACGSDRFDGVEFVIEANDYIPVDEVLEVIRDRDKLFAEQVGVTPDNEFGSRLAMFVVEASLDPSGKATYAEMEG